MFTGGAIETSSIKCVNLIYSRVHAAICVFLKNHRFRDLCKFPWQRQYAHNFPTKSVYKYFWCSNKNPLHFMFQYMKHEYCEVCLSMYDLLVDTRHQRINKRLSNGQKICGKKTKRKDWKQYLQNTYRYFLNCFKGILHLTWLHLVKSTCNLLQIIK